MTKAITLPFVPGQEVGIVGFTSIGVVDHVVVYGPNEFSFYIAGLDGRMIGSFSVYELYNLED